MYILHFMLIWLSPRLPVLNIELQPWLLYPLMVLGAWGIAAIAHRAIEQPGIDQGHRLARRLLQRFDTPAAV